MKTMPNNEAEERLRWISPILKGELTIEQMIKVCPFSERTLKYWLAEYREYGEEGLIGKSRKPHFCPWATSDEIKDKIIELRKDYHIYCKPDILRITVVFRTITRHTAPCTN